MMADSQRIDPVLVEKARTCVGTRLPDDTFPEEPGAYSKVFGGEWVVSTPDGCIFHLASERRPDRNGKHHEVEEHEDGSISVLPRPGNSNSILSPKGWHGYLERGVWRAV
jgi:hypothetical protein